jgi:DNA invertase Pin-like site-specific DNA recombinase
MTVKLIAYLRVSTDRQAEHGLGLAVQEQAIRAWAKEAGHRIVRWERDEGESGSNGLDSRLGLAAAFQELERANSIADGLVVYRLDRLARKLGSQITWIEQLESRGKQVISVTEPDVGQDEMRVFVRQVMGAVAEYERAVINRRMQSGRAMKAERGGYAGYGSPAFGQRSVDKQLVTDEREAAVTARMRELREAGQSFRQIAGQLDAEGMAPKRGGQWHPQTVSRVLARA